MPDKTAALAQLAVGVGANVAPARQLRSSPARAGAAGPRHRRRRLRRRGSPGRGRLRRSLCSAGAARARARRGPGPGDPLGSPPAPRAGRAQGALISLSGPAAPGLLDDVDPARIGRDTVAIKEHIQVIADRAINWTIVPGPSAAWAGLVYPDLRARRPSRGCGQRSPTFAAWTMRIRWRRGARAPPSWPRSPAGSARPSWTRCTSSGPEPTSRWGCCPGCAGTAGASKLAGVGRTCPTCPPRRCSPVPIPSAPKAPSPRPSRCWSPVAPCWGCGFPFSAAALSRSMLTREPDCCANWSRATPTPTVLARWRWSTPAAASALPNRVSRHTAG